MDIVREDHSRERRRKRILLMAVAAVALLAITLGLSRLKPAAPTVEKGTVWIDTVKRGEMLRQVRGPGSLVPEVDGIRWIAAATEGRVERLLVQPGAVVRPESVLVEMTNPELSRDALDADWQLKAGRAEFDPRLERLDLDLLVRSVVAVETRLAVRLSPGPPLTITGDPDQLGQLLINLVRNAADASLETGGRVAVGWDRVPGRVPHVVVWVEDEGPGLTRTENLFVPFFTTKPGGSGIGLVLSRQIAEAHRGTLSLDNRADGHGCRAGLKLLL